MNDTAQGGFIAAATRFVFGSRIPILILFALVTAFMFWQASQLRIDAGFEKQLPMKHDYMQTFNEYKHNFGGANRLLVALMDEDGNMFDAEYFKSLNRLTNEVFFIPGVNRASVRSIFTPNVRFVEIVEGGFAGGNVIPSDFAPNSPDFNPSEADFERIRSNIVKAGVVGQLVATDFSGAMVWADLLEVNPETGERLDYQNVAQRLEEIRGDLEKEGISMKVHIIGFAKIVGDIADGAKSVIMFFGLAILLTAILLYLYSGSLKLTIWPMVCSIIAVIWQLGGLNLLGFGIDPMNMLTPFLIFAIGVSHGVQMISNWNNEVAYGGEPVDDGKQAVGGVGPEEAAKRTFGKLLVPGSIALLSDTIGFLAIILIQIGIIQELAIAASVGVAFIILTNLLLLPIFLSYIKIRDIEAYRAKRRRKAGGHAGFWHALAGFTRPKIALVAILVAAALYGFGWYKGQDMKIGDSEPGVPELRQDARYNQDARLIADRFALGVDQLSVIAETVPDACTEHYQAMETIDRFAWHMRNVEGVQKVVTLPMIAKRINAGYNEGNIKFFALPRNNYVMRQNLQFVETDTGLLNARCDAMPIIIFADDHKAETINRLTNAVKEFNEANAIPLSDEMRAEVEARLSDDPSADQIEIGDWLIRFRLATGNMGVMAAMNEEVSAQQVPMLLYVYGAIIVLCLITFRSLLATLCIVLPLSLVSVLAYALMAFMGIGLKVNTLPVVALGVGIGVDYGIYIYSRLQGFLKAGMPLTRAYYNTLLLTGKPVVFTAITLAVGVATWLFSELKFQADMGVLLTFMFLLNMVGAVLLLPALARWLLRPREKDQAG